MTDDDDMGAYWRDVKAAQRQKRAENRKSSEQLLREAGVPFENKNGGSHLIVNHRGHIIDFWPGTGLWYMRGSTQRHYGVRKLLRLCKEES